MDFIRPLHARLSQASTGTLRFARLLLLGGLAATLAACGSGGGGSGGGGGSSNAAPIASFNATPNTGRFPLTVAFNATGSTDSDGTITTYAWTFGDGKTGTGATVSNTYAASGTFTATLTVTDNRGATGTTTRTVTVTPNVAPTANFTATPASGRAPLTVSFDAAGSTDGDGTIASHAWAFGNGNTATGVTASATYNAPGTYTATLTVTDNDGATGTRTRDIVVGLPFGTLAVTVKDSNGFAVPESDVSVVSGTTSKAGKTDAAGKLTLADLESGSTATVNVSRATFKSKSVSPVTITPNPAVTALDVVLERETKAIGGVLTSRVTASDAQSVEFEVTVVVVNEESKPINGLPTSAFKLEACAPDTATSTADCVAGLSGGQLALDAAYTPDPASGAALLPVVETPGGAPTPYAASLLFDQSDSIKSSDPTDARLFSAREFLAGLGADDRAALAAFASDGASGNLAKIPVTPVSIYPIGSPVFVADGTSFFPTLQELASQEGGRTPLYDAICRMIDFSAANAPAGKRQAIVAFTDGRNDTAIAPTDVCRTLTQATDRSAAKNVDIFTIGLSGQVDGEALATLADGGNGVFLFAEDAAQLITIYGSLGNLLSGSLTTYKLKYKVTTTVANTFQAGRGVLGTLSVNTGATTVSLPFVARIFAP